MCRIVEQITVKLIFSSDFFLLVSFIIAKVENWIFFAVERWRSEEVVLLLAMMHLFDVSFCLTAQQTTPSTNFSSFEVNLKVWDVFVRVTKLFLITAWLDARNEIKFCITIRNFFHWNRLPFGNCEIIILFKLAFLNTRRHSTVIHSPISGSLHWIELQRK